MRLEDQQFKRLMRVQDEESITSECLMRSGGGGFASRKRSREDLLENEVAYSGPPQSKNLENLENSKKEIEGCSPMKEIYEHLDLLEAKYRVDPDRHYNPSLSHEEIVRQDKLEDDYFDAMVPSRFLPALSKKTKVIDVGNSILPAKKKEIEGWSPMKEIYEHMDLLEAKFRSKYRVDPDRHYNPSLSHEEIVRQDKLEDYYFDAMVRSRLPKKTKVIDVGNSILPAKKKEIEGWSPMKEIYEHMDLLEAEFRAKYRVDPDRHYNPSLSHEEIVRQDKLEDYYFDAMVRSRLSKKTKVIDVGNSILPAKKKEIEGCSPMKEIYEHLDLLEAEFRAKYRVKLSGGASKEAEIGVWSLLPEELTMYIMVKLPAHDLIRYKLVCNVWRSLILSLASSPQLISAHLRHSISNPSSHFFLFHVDSPQPNVYDPRASAVYCVAPSVAIVGSVNGLICIVDNSSADDIWIVNPITRHIRKLPCPSRFPFDYSTDMVAFVFWWDSITGDDGVGVYKLAKIVSKPDYDFVVASVWVSTSPEIWNDIPVGFNGSFCRPSKIVSGCDVVVGDFAYWLVFSVIDVVHIDELFVLSLNLKTLSLSMNPFSFPLHFMTAKSLADHLLDGSNCYLFAGNWVGNFALVEKDTTSNMFSVWIMEEGVGWSNKSSFSVDFPILRCINDINGKLVFIRQVGASNRRVTVYDIGTGETELIEDYDSGYLLVSAHDFVGSFVSIEGFKPLEAADDLSPLLRVFWPYPSA